MNRSARRLAFGLTALAFSLTTSVAGVAAAHVTVDPTSQPSSGGYGQVRLVVPSEEDNTTTTAISVTLPTGVDLSSVRTLPIPGWTATTEKTQSNGSERVSKITWQASNPESGLKPTEYGGCSATVVRRVDVVEGHRRRQPGDRRRRGICRRGAVAPVGREQHAEKRKFDRAREFRRLRGSSEDRDRRARGRRVEGRRRPSVIGGRGARCAEKSCPQIPPARPLPCRICRYSFVHLCP